MKNIIINLDGLVFDVDYETELMDSSRLERIAEITLEGDTRSIFDYLSKKVVDEIAEKIIEYLQEVKIDKGLSI